VTCLHFSSARAPFQPFFRLLSAILAAALIFHPVALKNTAIATARISRTLRSLIPVMRIERLSDFDSRHQLQNAGAEQALHPALISV
jgi:hypothetical protein